MEKAGVIFLVARMKRPFMLTVHSAGNIGPMTDQRYFSRLTFALAYAWKDLECDVCNNTKECPYRASVAKRLHEEREGIDQEGTPVASKA